MWLLCEWQSARSSANMQKPFHSLHMQLDLKKKKKVRCGFYPDTQIYLPVTSL